MALPTPLHRPHIGFFGGTFDPFHIGHLMLVNELFAHAKVEKLLLCPAFKAPLRREKALFKACDRLAMVQAVASEHSRLKVLDYEIRRKRVCYTYETIQEVRRLYPTLPVLMLIGADQFNRLAQWKFLDRLLPVVHMLVFLRDRSTHPVPPKVRHLSYSVMKNPLVPVSSTEIRERIAKHQSVLGLVPQTVLDYLQTKDLPSCIPSP